MTSNEFNDRVALVTGAGRRGGIGAAIALTLARGGAHVVVADICAPPTELLAVSNPAWDELEQVAQEIEDAGVRALAARADVSDAESVQALVGQVVAQFGRLDILVNNAGIAISPGPVVFMPDEAWRRTLDINATGTFLCCKYALPPMLDAERGGRIINIASIAAEKPKPNVAAYAASKAAVVALTRSLAQEVAAFGITVNAILPGDVDTALKQWGVQLEADTRGIPYDEVLAAQVARIPLGRFAHPQDVAELAFWLASDAANYITGQTFNVTGGRELT
jgi:meso-butanediol dehydrogenase/(S,S)-butanediol dehydrogenase/diacetyl reductase